MMKFRNASLYTPGPLKGEEDEYTRLYTKYLLSISTHIKTYQVFCPF
jgi:hypothetical protein